MAGADAGSSGSSSERSSALSVVRYTVTSSIATTASWAETSDAKKSCHVPCSTSSRS